MTTEAAAAQKSDARTPLFADTVARPLCGGWALMNRQQGGYASRCIAFNTLGEIVSAYRVRVGERDRDEHGSFVRILRVTGAGL